MSRVWFVTGCGGGFGSALARRVLAGGDALVATDRDESLLDGLRAELPAELLRLRLDVTDDDAVADAASRALDRFGRIDVLVNNAGLGLGGPFEHVDLREVRKLFAVNAVGPMAVTSALLPAMRERGAGRIVNVSSDSGKVGFPFQNVYGATKHAVEGWSESLALELAPFGLSVHVVEPCGMFKTPMPRDAVAAAKAALPPGSPYAPMINGIAAGMAAEWEHATDPDVVAEAIHRIGTAGERPPFRTRIGPPDRTKLAVLRHDLGDEEFLAFLGRVTMAGAQPQAGAGQVSGGALVMRTLAAADVTHMFGLVGGHNYELVDACLDHGIRFVDVRHEQQAAHLADGYARFTGRPAAVAVDGAPGLVNAFPGIQVAHEALTPMVCVSAQGSLAGRDMGVMQAIDQLAVVRPVTKWQRTCFEQRRLPEYTAAAVRHATTGRPGPTFLDFPLEHLRATVDGDDVPAPTGWRAEARPYPDPAAVRRALDVLRLAARPMLVVGSGLWWADAGEELRALVDSTGIPVLCRNAARGLVPEDHPSALGFFPAPAGLADAFLVVGTRLDWTIGNGKFPLFGTQAPVVQVDVHAESIGKNGRVDVGIVADAKAFLRALLDLLRSEPWEVDADWPRQARAAVTAMRTNVRSAVADRPADAPIHSIELVDALAAWLPRDAVTVVDGGYIAGFALQLLDAYSPGGVTWVGSTGHLGVGVSFAMAAKLAHPERTVVALCGDGSYGLSGLEFDTAVRHDLPVIVVVANDAGWGEIRDGQRRRFGDDRVLGSELGASAYHDIAIALGGHGELVRRLDELPGALQRAAEAGRPALVNVLTDPRQRSTAVAGLPWHYE